MANLLQRAVIKAARPLGLQLVENNLLPVPGNQAQVQAAQSSLNQFFKYIGLTMYTSGDWKMSDYITKGYEENAILYSVVNRIMRTCAIAPFKVYTVKDEAKHLKYKAYTGANATVESLQAAIRMKALVYEENTTHPLNALIEKPNKYQGGNEFTQLSIGYKLLTGNRIWFKNVLDAGANAGKPVGIYNLPPQCGSITAGSVLYDIIEYIFFLNKEIRIPPDLIIHSRYPNFSFDGSGSHLWGMAPLKAGRRTTDRSSAAERRAVTLLETAGAAGVLFNKMQTKPDPVYDGLLKKKLNEEILGADNAGAIAIANGDLGYLNFGQTAKDMEILGVERYTDEKIINLFHAPPGLWLSNANATDNNIRAWLKQLITQACIPELVSLRDDWNEVAKLYKGDKIYVDYGLECYPELLEDQNQLALRLDKMWYYTGNEKRIMTGGDEDTEEPMLNRYFIPSSLKEINDANPNMLEDEITRTERETETDQDS